METVEELVDFLDRALDGSARDRVVDTGEAWSIVKRDGVLPEDAPRFRETLDADLAEYGFTLLDAGLALTVLERGHPMARRAFVTSGRTFENLVRNGDPTDPQRGFHRVMAAAAYHLGSYAAIAYALFAPVDSTEQNLNTAEACLVRLMLRDLNGVRETARGWLRDPWHQDDAISERLQRPDGDRDSEFALILICAVCRALANYEFALRTGKSAFVATADEMLSDALELATETGIVSLWWVIRLTRYLLNDLWSQSLHVVLPLHPPKGAIEAYGELRTIFIASLSMRDVAEIELWPSQIDAARRAADPADDLVVALPTSAGKTRVAELATLTALSMGKRILVVTPLRALSAQSERSFRSRFAPLGATISSLYGKSGLPEGDADALRRHQIVVSTPEKLDFALRSDPTVIADIGLIVLDEGHLIGPGEREIHYEVLVQRLLRRADADERRIVCLSAILPDGEELNDMTAWIRSDAEGQPIRSDWRPTRQRYGTLEWRGGAGRLNYDLEDDGPFVPRFIEELQPRGRERNARPRDPKDVALMSAWRFAEDGKRALIFITQANWVEGYGDRAVELVKRGYLPSLLKKPNSVEAATTIGAEWLGHDHPAVRCLHYGVAVHHGKLPSPFLREVERVLASGAIKVTAASPTLAQGLNLNAAVLLVPYLVRAGVPISGEELANVAGRAGRAFVDTEGLVLHVMNDRFAKRRKQWRQLVNGAKERSLTSGFLIVIDQVVKRLAARGIAQNDAAYEFLTNAREAWFEDSDEADGEPFEDLVAKLDSIVFGLIEALDADDDELPKLLDEALSGSLWARQMERLDSGFKRMQMIVLKARARLIWNETTAQQRHGHFAMGVGLDAGLRVDEMADALGDDLDRADLAALQADIETLHGSLTRLAERLLTVRPFVPDDRNALEDNWIEVLRRWISGASLSDISAERAGLIEDVFTFRLVWALEALRVRRLSGGWEPETGRISGAAAACLDTGLPDYRMALLVRGGLASREAARMVINEHNPDFLKGNEMRQWLMSDTIDDLSLREDWPSESTAFLWRRFRNEALSDKEHAWRVSSESFNIAELRDTAVTDRALLRVEDDADGGPTWLATPDFRIVGRLDTAIDVASNSVTYAELDLDGDEAHIWQIGPDILNEHE